MFQDIGIGILISILTAHIFQVDLSYFLVIMGVIFALLPDIDFSLPKKLVGGHRGIVHYPFVYVVIGAIIFFMFGDMWAFLFLSGTLQHLIHDTFFLGWGIKWFWPLSDRNFKFFPDKDGRISRVLFLSWLPPEEGRIKEEYKSPNWIKDFYFRPNIISISEYSILIAAVTMLFMYYI